MTIPRDKLLHFVAGFVVSFVAYVATSNATISFSLSALLGIAKEVYDSRGHGTVEVADAVATAVGGAVGAVIIRVVM